MEGGPARRIAYRVVTSRLFNRAVLAGLDFGWRRFGGLVPREWADGPDRFFIRGLLGNCDADGDGVAESFRLPFTNAWFDQRITGIVMSIDGRRVSPERLLVRAGGAEMRACDITTLEFPPGETVEVIASGMALGDGLHLLEFLLEMELASQDIPILPVVMRGGRGEVAIVEDRFAGEGDWPPTGLEPGVAHVVPHIHYDVEWLKTAEVFERVGVANLREALRLMDADPRMTFVVDQVPQLEALRHDDPGAFARLVALAGEGRVEALNGMYAEPDTNLVSGESLVRQTIAWQEYASDAFGGPSSCGWLPDSFGMSAQLPQIFALSGTRFLAFSRARVAEGHPSEFVWEGIDGTRITCHDMPGMYNIGHPMPVHLPSALRKMAKGYRLLRARSATPSVFYPCGVDHGRPQKEYAETARAWNEEVDGVSFEMSTPSRFFDSLPGEGLPVLRGEFQRELWGTYSARTRHKQLNRACEFALQDAGKMQHWPQVTSFRTFHEKAGALENLWRKLMDCQFHDQICGCCTDEVARGMEGRFRQVLEGCEAMMGEAARALAGAAESEDGFRLLVFNPLAQAGKAAVEFEVAPPPGWHGIAVRDASGEVVSQVVDASRYGDGSLKRARVLIAPGIPGIGFKVFGLEPTARPTGVPRTAGVPPASTDDTSFRTAGVPPASDDDTSFRTAGVPPASADDTSFRTAGVPPASADDTSFRTAGVPPASADDTSFRTAGVPPASADDTSFRTAGVPPASADDTSFRTAGVPPASATGAALSNGILRADVNETTGLLERITLAGGRTFEMNGANRLTLEKDFGDLYLPFALGTTWAHRRKVDCVRAVESGPLRATIEVSGRVGRSDFVQKMSLTAGSPLLHCETEVYLRDRHCRLRVRFPTGIEGGTWVHEVPCGWLERPGHELPAQTFVDLSGGGRGVTLINSGLPANKHADGTMFLTLARSVDRIYSWDAGPEAMELGRRTFRYALYPHEGDHVAACSALEAHRFANPPRAFVLDGGGPGSDAPGALECESGDVLVSVMEPSRDGGITIRLWETSGSLPLEGEASPHSSLPLEGEASPHSSLPLEGKASPHSSLPLEGEASPYSSLPLEGEASPYSSLPLEGGGSGWGCAHTSVFRLGIDASEAWKTDLLGNRLERLNLEAGRLEVPLHPFEIATIHIE